MMILWLVVPVLLIILTVMFLYKKVNSAVKYFLKADEYDIDGCDADNKKQGKQIVLLSLLFLAIIFIPAIWLKMTWFIILLHFVVLLLVTDVIVWIIEKIGHRKHSVWFIRIYKTGLIAICITAIMMVYGYFNIYNVVNTEYTIHSDKDIRSEGYRILVLSDLHYGLTLDATQLKEQVEKMSYDNPDIVVLDGDIVDESTTYEQMQEVFKILSGISNRYGIYYIYGNHDKATYTSKPAFTPEQLEQAIVSSGINILEDDTAVINNELILIGRADKGDTVNERKSIDKLVSGLDTYKEWIVLDHQPADYKLAQQNGADIIISGHTHAGQIWPAGYISSLLHLDELNYGYKNVDNMSAIVTSGIAGWGFPIRTQKHSEYVIINVL